MKPIKALSIKQPWASLIAHGIKDIENRTWKTNFRGRIYIHASAKWVPQPKGFTTYGKIYTDEQWRYIIAEYEESLTPILVPVKPDAENNNELPLSAIIGEVNIVDCVINHSSIWAEKTEGVLAGNHFFYERPIWNWVLANAVLYEKPILNVKGKLSFWEPAIDIAECIGCSEKFDYETMQQDNAGEDYCPECTAEMFPVMKAEYEEMVRNGEIEEN
ncbi:ASCH domain-containing protein [Chryseobacterium sp. KACC 21268]|nr:ASCH domain-containing protein [Chryseobacterium sp. KACC 21268]